MVKNISNNGAKTPSLPNKGLPAFNCSIALFLILSKSNSSFIKNCVSKVYILFYSLLTQFKLHPRGLLFTQPHRRVVFIPLHGWPGYFYSPCSAGSQPLLSLFYPYHAPVLTVWPFLLPRHTPRGCFVCKGTTDEHCSSTAVAT